MDTSTDTPPEHKAHVSAPAGALETFPLAAGIVAIAIPVGLLALAAVEESVLILVFAVLGMFCVGGAALMFIIRLASDVPDPVEGEDPSHVHH